MIFEKINSYTCITYLFTTRTKTKVIDLKTIIASKTNMNNLIQAINFFSNYLRDLSRVLLSINAEAMLQYCLLCHLMAVTCLQSEEQYSLAIGVLYEFIVNDHKQISLLRENIIL